MQFDDLLLHPTTKQQLSALRTAMPHAVLLTGPKGVGLHTIAQVITGGALIDELIPRDSKDTPSASGTISIKYIRELYEKTRSVHTSSHYIVIDDADAMSLGAQTALLKLLEEPAASIHFILTSHQPSRLLPTVRSRMQTVQVLPLTPQQTSVHISKHTSDTKLQTQLTYVASGLPATLHHYMEQSELIDATAELISDARRMIDAPIYDKLTIVQAYGGDRQQSLRLIDTMITILERSYQKSPQPPIIRQLSRLLATYDAVATTAQSPKLQLLRCVL